MAARPLSGERAWALRRVPHATRPIGSDGAVAVVRRCSPQPHRRARHHAGVARQGSAFGDMHPVIMLSARNLTEDDLNAAVTYLLGDSPPAMAPPSTNDPADISAAAN